MSLAIQYESSASSSDSEGEAVEDTVNTLVAKESQKRPQPDDSKSNGEEMRKPVKRLRVPPPPTLSPPRVHREYASIGLHPAGSRSLLAPPQVRRQGSTNVSIEDLQQFGTRRKKVSSDSNRLSGGSRPADAVEKSCDENT